MSIQCTYAIEYTFLSMGHALLPLNSIPSSIMMMIREKWVTQYNDKDIEIIMLHHVYILDEQPMSILSPPLMPVEQSQVPLPNQWVL